jgi:hypothetical protein
MVVVVVVVVGYGSLDFRGYVLCGVLVIEVGWGVLDLDGKDIITIFVQQS